MNEKERWFIMGMGQFFFLLKPKRERGLQSRSPP